MVMDAGAQSPEGLNEMKNKKQINFMPEECSKERLNILFDSTKIETIFKKDYKNIKYILLKNKEEIRFSEMIKAIFDQTKKLYEFQNSAINHIVYCEEPEKRLAARLGIIHLEANGVNVCQDCLNKTILMYKDNLQTLEDLQEAVKRINE